MATSFEYACDYAKSGLRVMPVEPYSKKPLLANWPDRASKKTEVLKEWFEEHPDRNIGIVLGQGVFAIDIDERRDGVKAWNRLTRGRNVPHTAVAESGGGGWHYLFRCKPGLVVPTDGEFAEGVEVRGEGAGLIVSPSLHPDTGRQYEWVTPPSAVIARAPRWLHDRVAVPRGKVKRPKKLQLTRQGDVEGVSQLIVERFPVEGPSTRNAVMMQAVYFLAGQGFPEDISKAALLDWWAHYSEMGTIRTPIGEAPSAIQAAFTWATTSGKVSPAVSSVKHTDEIAKIFLNDRQREAISQIQTVRSGNSFYTGLTLSGIWLESLVVHFTYEASRTLDGPLKATDKQLAAIVQTRHGVILQPPEIERLKLKFTTRPDKPARRHEMLIETRKGCTWGRGGASEYVLTGLNALLAL